VVYAFTRSLGATTLLVIANFSGESAPAPVPESAQWAAAELVLGNCPDPGPASDALVLAPWEARVYRRVR
jgi:hypothetical protein